MKKKKETLRTGTVQTEMPVKEEAAKALKNAAEAKKAFTMKSSDKIGTSIRLILGLLLLLLGLWLWTKTLGTQLLFTDVTIGRVSRYWFIPVVIGLVLLMTAVYSAVRKPRPEKEREVDQVPTGTEAETANAEPQTQSTAVPDGTEEQTSAEAPDGTEEKTPVAVEFVGDEPQPPSELKTVVDESKSQADAQAVDTGQQIPAQEEIS